MPAREFSRRTRIEASSESRLGAASSKGIANGAKTVPKEARRNRGDLGNQSRFRKRCNSAVSFWDQGQLIILTNGFDKKSQKTPAREIAVAEQRRTDYLNRKRKV